MLLYSNRQIMRYVWEGRFILPSFLCMYVWILPDHGMQEGFIPYTLGQVFNRPILPKNG